MGLVGVYPESVAGGYLDIFNDPELVLAIQASAKVHEEFSAEHYPPYGGFYLYSKIS
jgi:hypothetical protein